MPKNELMRGVYDLIIIATIIDNKGTYNKYKIYTSLKDKNKESIAVHESTVYDAIRRLKSKDYLIEEDGKIQLSVSGMNYYQQLKSDWQKVREIVDKYI